MRYTGRKNLTALRGRAISHVNATAESTRQMFVTPGSAMAMTYARKAEEARRYVAAGEPEDLTGYPMLRREVGLTAPDAHQLAQIWLNLDGIWEEVAAQIERARLTTNARINSAPSQEEINRHRDEGDEVLWAVARSILGA